MDNQCLAFILLLLFLGASSLFCLITSSKDSFGILNTSGCNDRFVGDYNFSTKQDCLNYCTAGYSRCMSQKRNGCYDYLQRCNNKCSMVSA